MPSPEHEILYQQAQACHAAATQYRDRYALWDSPLAVAGIALGLLATGLAGGSAFVGPPAVEFFGGWRALCYTVAGITFVGTAVAGAHKTVRFAEKRVAGEQCIGLLIGYLVAMRSMDIKAATDALAGITRGNGAVLHKVKLP